MRYVHFCAFSSNTDNILGVCDDIFENFFYKFFNFSIFFLNITIEPKHIIRITRKSSEMNVSQRVDVASYLIFFWLQILAELVMYIYFCFCFHKKKTVNEVVSPLKKLRLAKFCLKNTQNRKYRFVLRFFKLMKNGSFSKPIDQNIFKTLIQHNNNISLH